MKSPFPGMDPYLEQSWRDVHHRIITYAQGRLNDSLPRDLRARVAERLFVEAEESGIYDEPASQGFIEITDGGSGNRLVTVLEFLSPPNKLPGPGQDQYLRKQRELLDGRINLVEIDLVRTGHHVLAVPSHLVPPSHRTPYRVCVRRGSGRPRAELYRVPLRERLPAIKVPLRESDADVVLDLQALIDLCYHHGRYDDIDYKADPVPALEGEDAAWADGLLRAAGKR